MQNTMTSGVALLAGSDIFRGLPPADLATIEAAATEVHIAAGESIVREGDRGDALYVIVSGTARVTRRVRVRQQVIRDLGPGAVLGEIALLDAAGLRTATVTAIEPVVALRVAAPAVVGILDKHPDMRARVDAGVRGRLNGDVLLGTTSLAKLSDEGRERLTAGARRVALHMGDAVVTEGSRGDTCFALITGEAEVSTAGAGRVITRLGPGALIGEIALLADEPRTATVRMTVDGEVLAIDREALFEVLRGEDNVRADVARLMSSRIAPRRRPDVIAESRSDTGVTILKDTRRHAYYRLSAFGRFIWDRLDGDMTVQELTVAAYREQGTFAPALVAVIVEGLVDAGFAQAPQLSADLTFAQERSAWMRLLHGALALATFVWTVDGIDPWLTRTYRRGGRLLFSRPMLASAAAVLVVGVGALVAKGPHSVKPFGQGLGWWVVLALIPGYGFAVVLHELAHALTVKRFGRQVHRAGIGWYMWGPIAFVDTSDMWLDDRGPRILVTLAGPLTNALIGAGFSLIALVAGTGAAGAIVWQFALANFLIALINLNPMLEVDGYYILMDALDRPQLRREALSWIGGPMWHDLAARRGIGGHRLDLGYGLASLTYVAVCGTLTVLWLRSVLAHALNGIVAMSAADILAWTVSLLLLATLVLATIAQLRGARLSRRTSG